MKSRLLVCYHDVIVFFHIDTYIYISLAAASLLFRGNSIASKMMSAFSRLVGGDYLRSALSGSLESIKSAGAFEVGGTGWVIPPRSCSLFAVITI